MIKRTTRTPANKSATSEVTKVQIEGDKALDSTVKKDIESENNSEIVPAIVVKPTANIRRRTVKPTIPSVVKTVEVFNEASSTNLETTETMKDSDKEKAKKAKSKQKEKDKKEKAKKKDKAKKEKQKEKDKDKKKKAKKKEKATKAKKKEKAKKKSKSNKKK